MSEPKITVEKANNAPGWDIYAHWPRHSPIINTRPDGSFWIGYRTTKPEAEAFAEAEKARLVTP